MSPKKPLVPQTAWGRLVEAAPEEGVQPLKNAKRIETGRIYPDPRQPRKHFDDAAMQELMDSIAYADPDTGKQRGILQPITVQADGQGRYFIVTGERRWRAASALGLETVPAIVVDLAEPELRLDRVIENRQRADLSDMEFADALEEIREDLGARAPNLTSNELDEHVGERLGISGRTVRSFIALNNLPAEVKQLLGAMRTELRTRGLARLRDNPARQMALAQAVVDHDLSGRQTVAAATLLKRNPAMAVEEAVARVLGRHPAPAAAPPDERDPRRQHYWHVRTTLHQALHAIRAPAPDADEAPLTGVELREFYQLLEPLAGLYAQLTPLLAEGEGSDATARRVRLSEILAAWEEGQAQSAPRPARPRPALYPVPKTRRG